MLRAQPGFPLGQSSSALLTAQSWVCSLMHIMLIVQEDGPNNDGSLLWKGYHCTCFSCMSIQADM